jgi:hypothetical protein
MRNCFQFCFKLAFKLSLRRYITAFEKDGLSVVLSCVKPDPGKAVQVGPSNPP